MEVLLANSLLLLHYLYLATATSRAGSPRGSVATRSTCPHQWVIICLKKKKELKLYTVIHCSTTYRSDSSTYSQYCENLQAAHHISSSLVTLLKFICLCTSSQYCCSYRFLQVHKFYLPSIPFLVPEMSTGFTSCITSMAWIL
jgi:hypothetical protein